MDKSIVYTRTGDKGTTSLVGGKRVRKNDIRIEAYGTIDELNSHIGIVDAHSTHLPDIHEMLLFVQHRLFNIGGYLASDPESYEMPCGVSDDDITRMEHMIDIVDSRLPDINKFVLPGGTMAAAQCHVARTVCRRAERRIIDLGDTTDMDSHVTTFVNRLSDFLFVLARFFNVESNKDEIFWNKDC